MNPAQKRKKALHQSLKNKVLRKRALEQSLKKKAVEKEKAPEKGKALRRKKKAPCQVTLKITLPKI